MEFASKSGIYFVHSSPFIIGNCVCSQYLLDFEYVNTYDNLTRYIYEYI